MLYLFSFKNNFYILLETKVLNRNVSVSFHVVSATMFIIQYTRPGTQAWKFDELYGQTLLENSLATGSQASSSQQSYERDKPFQPNMSLSRIGVYLKETQKTSDIRKHLLTLEHPYQYQRNTQQM